MTKWISRSAWIAALFAFPLHHASAQGQDSTPVLRDRQVIGTLLPGVWNNNNQSYFDRRIGVPDADAHGRLHVEIERDDSEATGFRMRLRWGTDSDPAAEWQLALADGADAVAQGVNRVMTE